MIPDSAGAVPTGVGQALASHPHALFIATTYGATAARAMREARAAGFHGTFLGGSAFNSASTGEAGGGSSAGQGRQRNRNRNRERARG